MKQALRLAARGCGCTSPNPMVGAVLVKGGRLIGRGWHRRAGGPHAEIEALRDAAARGESARGASLYVTLEPCCTHGRTPPCTEALLAAGVARVFVAAIDLNPQHAGRGLAGLRRAGVRVEQGILAEAARRLNESFDHWITTGLPLVTVKSAMTLDGKIATARGESKWITGPKARAWSMKLRQGADAILVGVNTVLADDPALTFRGNPSRASVKAISLPRRRVILDSRARTPLTAQVVCDALADRTIVVVTDAAPPRRRMALAHRVQVWTAPAREGRIDLSWLLQRLGQAQVTSLLVEGGGEVNASFLLEGLTQRVVFFFAPKIMGGADACQAVAGRGVEAVEDALRLREVEWKRLDDDWMLTARVGSG
jgi:diaminohydroxyphosphoribosylaminopyrimidine deaminase/5-amino-6-(5-phosphoribosylamino)uracil reductase